MLPTLVPLVFAVSGLLAQTRNIWPRLSCGKGEWNKRLGDNFVCLPCQDGSFIDEDNHSYQSCKPCRNYSREIDYVEEWEPCTRERDSVVRSCVDSLKMFVQYDALERRYHCTQRRGDDFHNTATTTASTPATRAASTPATRAGSLGTSSLPTDADNRNLTKCDDIVNEDCLGSEFINKTCLYSIGLVEQSLLCQNCPKYRNMTVCSNTPKETANRVTVSSELSSDKIVAIITCSVILVVAMLGAGMWFCYRRATSQNYRTYEMAIGETISLNKKNEQKCTNTRTETSEV